MRLQTCQPLVERHEIDQPAGMAALADAARALEGCDIVADHPALDRDHRRRGPYHRADRRRPEMADIDLGANSSPAFRQKAVTPRR